MSKADSLPGVSVERAAGAKIRFKASGKARTLAVRRFDEDLAFVSLPQLAGVAGLNVDFDNESKVAKLTNIVA